LIESLRSLSDRKRYSIYTLALAVSISTWFITIRAPLWLDETVSFFLIRGGFAGIISRHVWPDSPVYSCLLWLWTKAMGTGEVTLRISSILPMLAATWLLYRAARELFDRDVAIIAAIVFCLHPIIIFAADDVRPYAFAALAINATILALVHLRHNNSNWLAALFGVSAACIVEFQLLFATLLPALVIGFFALKTGDRKILWRQLSIALVVFAFGVVPAIPRVQYMLHTSNAHVFSEAPSLVDLRSTIVDKPSAIVLAATLLLAGMTRRIDLRRDFDGRTMLLCASLALIPLLILYGVSIGTSMHVFVYRYRLVAVPGIALCWAWVISRINSRALRLLFSTALVTVTACIYFSSPLYRHHQYSWKSALAFVEQNGGHAPVLICSDLPEADHMAMPVGSAIEESGILPPLSYYKLSAPVVVLPRALNGEAVRVGSQFIHQAAEHHERFFALAFAASYSTLDWLADHAAATHSVRKLGVFDGVKVLEFIPRTQADPSR
jgi:hypothetical protein